MNLLELHKAGSIELLFRRGLLSAEIYIHFKMVDYYLEQRELGHGYNSAILTTCIAFNRSESTVKRAIRKIVG